MTLLIAGLLFFIGVHVVTMLRDARADLVGRYGEGTYKGVYSIASGVGLVLIIWGFVQYRAGGYIQVWNPPVWSRHLAWTLMLPVFPLLIAAYVPGRIKAVLKHPMLTAIKFWALAHLIANGDLGSMLLFGSLLVWAVVDRISVKRRADQSEVAAARAPDAATATRNDIISLVAGLGLYVVVFLWLHPILFGVSARG